MQSSNCHLLFSLVPIHKIQLTRATLMSPGKDETRACGYTYYIYIYVYVINVQYFIFTLNFRHINMSSTECSHNQRFFKIYT